MLIIVISLFLSILLQQEWRVGSRIKKMRKIPIDTPIKILDCFPCWSFWTSIIIGLVFFIFHLEPIKEIVTQVLLTYIISNFYEKT